MVIGIYFTFIPPLLFPFYQLWTLVIYPAVMLLIAGEWIIAYWMGNPFENQYSQETFMDFAAWRDAKSENIESLFKLRE